ncbi:MAG TPA: hypothetical protein VNQ76_10745 [Planctomicrobium sp.]|nr:hypothetical protein [Planctomicrobium sp.]
MSPEARAVKCISLNGREHRKRFFNGHQVVSSGESVPLQHQRGTLVSVFLKKKSQVLENRLFFNENAIFCIIFPGAGSAVSPWCQSVNSAGKQRNFHEMTPFYAWLRQSDFITLLQSTGLARRLGVLRTG